MTRNLLKSLVRSFYASGTLILLLGMLLSATNKPALASGFSNEPEKNSASLLKNNPPEENNTPQVTEETETPSVTETVVVTETVAVTETPVTTETVVVTKTPKKNTKTPSVTETVVVTETPVTTETVEITETPVVTETVEVSETPVVTETLVVTEVPNDDPGDPPADDGNNEEGPVPTLSAPQPQQGQAPVLIPVTGIDLSNADGLLGGLFTNIGLVILGLAMVLTGFYSRLK